MATRNFKVVTVDQAITVVFEMLSSQYTSNHRPLLLGDPGSGKSAAIKQATKLLGERKGVKAVLIDLRMLNMDLGAFRGLEHIITHPDGRTETVNARPYFFPPYLADDEIDDSTTIYVIFLDEITACDDMMRKSGFELLTEHRSGPHLLGKNVLVCAGGNTAEDGTTVQEMDRATRRRFCPMFVETTQASLLAYAIAENWHYHVISLIRNNPGCVSASEEDVAAEMFSLTSSASLERVSEAFYAWEAKEIGELTLEVETMGMLGEVWSDALLTAVRDEKSQFDLMKLIEAAPNERVYPESEFGVYSLIGALASYATDADRLKVAVDVALGMPNDLNSIIQEVKNAFFSSVHEKMVQWGLFLPYSRDPNVRQFLTETANTTDEADQEFADRQAEGEQAQQLKAA